MSTMLILISIFGLLWVTNRVLVVLREGHTWTIKKGHHYANLSLIPLVLRNRKSGKFLSVKFKINQKMLYAVPGADQYDWNKIAGEGFLSWTALRFFLKSRLIDKTGKAIHHYSSWRLGWRFVTDEQKVHLAIYYYQDGVRKEDLLHTFSWYGLTDTEPEFNLAVSYTNNGIDFDLLDKFGKIVGSNFVLESKNHNGLCFRLRPFFGGNQPAPVTQEVFYKFFD